MSDQLVVEYIRSGNMRWLSSIFWPMHLNMNMVRPWRKIFVARNSQGERSSRSPSCPCNLETCWAKRRWWRASTPWRVTFAACVWTSQSLAAVKVMVPSHHYFHRTKVRLSPWRISTVHICTWMRHPCFACHWLSSKLLSISSLNIKLMLPLPEQISTKSLRFGFSGKQPVQTLHSRKLGN